MGQHPGRGVSHDPSLDELTSRVCLSLLSTVLGLGARGRMLSCGSSPHHITFVSQILGVVSTIFRKIFFVLGGEYYFVGKSSSRFYTFVIDTAAVTVVLVNCCFNL